jgi:WD40 repeat protein
MIERGQLHTERLEFSPDGQFLMIHCWEFQPDRGTGLQFTVHFLEIASKQVRATFVCDRTASAAFFPAGNEFVYYHRNGADKVVKVERWRLDDKFPAAGPIQTHEVVADQCALSPRLDVFATITEPPGPDDLATLQLWDLATGEEKARVEGVRPERSFRQLEFSPSGQFLIQNGIYWRADSQLEKVGAGLQKPCISLDDHWFLTPVKAREPELHDTATMEKRGTLWAPGDRATFSMMWPSLPGSPPTIEPVSIKYQFAPDSKTVIVTGITEPARGNSVTDFLGQYIAKLKPTERSVARLWDVETAQELATFHFCRGLYSPALYSTDGKTLATAHEDGTVKVWDVPPRKPVWLLVGVTSAFWLTTVVGLQLWRRVVRWWFRGKAVRASDISPG